MKRVDNPNEFEDEDVLVQGSTYSDEDEDVLEAGESSEGDGDLDDRSSSLINLTDKQKPIVILGVIILLFLVIVGSYVYMSAAGGKTPAEEEPIVTEDVVVFEYTPEEVEALRLAGYTGDEIDEHEYEQQDAQALVDDAEALRQEQYDKEIKPLYDGASDEFKKLWNNSWVGQPDLDWDKDVEGYSYYTDTVNVDYIKLPATGHQLFIKFKLKNGDACFMNVTPERYVELDKKGNIVLSISYTQSADEKFIITSIAEVQP